MSVTNIDLARFDWEWKNGSRTRAKTLAQEYIRDHYADLAPVLKGHSVEELVRMIEIYREQGVEESRIVVDMWIYGGFIDTTPIVGYVEVTLPQAYVSNTDVPDVAALHRMQQLWRMDRRDESVQVAKDYANEHREQLAAVLSALTIPELVKVKEQFEAEGQQATALVVDAWIRSEYPPQMIVGQIQAGITQEAIERALRRKRILQVVE